MNASTNNEVLSETLDILKCPHGPVLMIEVNGQTCMKNFRPSLRAVGESDGKWE